MLYKDNTSPDGFSILSFVLVSIKGMYQPLKTVFKVIPHLRRASFLRIVYGAI